MKTLTLTDMFQQHYGATEYDSFVMKMIKWYYGYEAKVAWCAISMSYMANQLGILDQFGRKNQNCFEMLTTIEKTIPKTKKGKLTYKKDIPKGYHIKRGTVVFILHDAPPMDAGSHKHVTTVNKDFDYNGVAYFTSLGGNQGDKIQTKDYPQAKIYAIFEPDYTVHKTLRRGDKCEEVKELQRDLINLGFGRITGRGLLAGGSFKSNTENCVKLFQQYTKCCTPDGVAGKKTWAMIDKMLSEPLHTTEAMTNVYVRIAPSLEFKKKSKVLEGAAVQYTNIVDGWLYIPKKKGWSMSKYYKL